MQGDLGVLFHFAPQWKCCPFSLSLSLNAKRIRLLQGSSTRENNTIALSSFSFSFEKQKKGCHFSISRIQLFWFRFYSKRATPMWADQASFCEEEQLVSVAGNFSRHNIVIYCYELYSNLYILFLRCALESYRQSWETTGCCNGLRWQNVVPILWCAPKFNRKMNTLLRQILGDVEGRWRNIQ